MYHADFLPPRGYGAVKGSPLSVKVNPGFILLLAIAAA
jgi:hypothetical protein